MDAFLAAEAKRSLKALALFSGTGQHGFLIGHKRGPRFFIESIIPSGKKGLFDYASLREADKIDNGKTVGFFFLGGKRTARNRILKPYAFGKLCLEARLNSRRKLSFKAFAIEYEGKFRFSPLPLFLSPEGEEDDR